MNPADNRNEDYSYEDAGFDGFLSRSIDNTSRVNLESQGPVSTAMRYDSAQTSGFFGDKLQIGNVTIDGTEGNIKVSDGENIVVVIGKID